MLDKLVDIEESYNTGKGGQFIAITGESGSGKSALLANWWKRLKDREAQGANLISTFFHSIGISGMVTEPRRT